MNLKNIVKYFPPLGVLVGLTLMGCLLLSAYVYYSAVKIQRFSEPALALAQPRIEFAHSIVTLFSNQFAERKIKGVHFTTDSIFIEESLLLTIIPTEKIKAPPILRELGKTFLLILEDPEIRSYIDLILISTRKGIGTEKFLSKLERRKLQTKADFILNSLVMVEPSLGTRYNKFFAATALAVAGTGPEKNQAVEFRFIPTERLHVDVLKKLQKYTR